MKVRASARNAVLPSASCAYLPSRVSLHRYRRLLLPCRSFRLRFQFRAIAHAAALRWMQMLLFARSAVFRYSRRRLRYRRIHPHRHSNRRSKAARIWC